nr:VOC family protein [Cypionkella sp.]
MLHLDHIAIAADTLAHGVAFVEHTLGVTMAGGGQHPHMATHNRLLGMGDLYLEVIAIDPDAERPKWPRWFDLDNFSGGPQLTNWILSSENLDSDLTKCPEGTGKPVALQRGDYRWQMAVPADGKLPFDNAFPALIQWEGSLHPAAALPESGIRLTELIISHPKADTLQALMAPLFSDPRVTFHHGPAKSISAHFSTPNGPRTLR